MWTMNVVLPWDCTTTCETFQTEVINLEEPKANPSLQDWEQLDYDPKLQIKLSTYREEIRSRKTSFKWIQRLNTYMPFMLWFNFPAQPLQKPSPDSNEQAYVVLEGYLLQGK